MEVDVSKLVQRCLIFQKSKGATTNPGLYLPLPMLSKPWELISIDFVLGLPLTVRRADNIYVVDRFSKIAHFIPSRKSNNASCVADLFFRDVYKLHGLPHSIVLERDISFRPFLKDVVQEGGYQLRLQHNISSPN